MTRIQLAADTQLQATADNRPRITIRAYGGGIMQPRGVSGDVVISLDGIQADKKVPLLLDHKNEVAAIAGHGAATVENGALVITGELVDSAAARSVVALAKSGVELKASVGGTIASGKYIDAGETIQINGRTITAGPDGLLLVTAFSLHETSIVPLAADASTSIRVAANRRRNRAMSDFQSFVSQVLPDADLSDMTEGQVAALVANYNGRTSPTAEDRAAVGRYITASADDPVAEEERRVRQIARAVRPPAEGWGDHEDRVRDLKARATRNELDVDELLGELRPIRAEIEDARIPMANNHIASGRRRGNVDDLAIEAALCLSNGLSEPEKHFPEQVLDAADKMRGLSLQGVLLQAAAANGFDVRPGTRVSQANLRSILQAAFAPVQASAGFSTVSIANITSNVANKFLHEGWNSVDQTALRISGRRPVNDFKQATTVSLLGDTMFEQLPPDGEIKHGALSDLTYTNKADTYARMLTITRTDIINDDTSALTQAPRKLGRGGILKLNDILWAMFLNNASFFTAGNNNVSTGAGSALSVDGLTAAERVFMLQEDPDGNPLGMMPSILLVPPSLKARALELMTSGLVVTGSDTVRPDGNVWQGRYRVESSPYLENANYTGNSSTAWYLLAEPSALAVIEIAALNGRVEPIIETAQADFSVLGFSMRGYSDVGVNLQEPRAGVRSAGA